MEESRTTGRKKLPPGEKRIMISVRMKPHLVQFMRAHPSRNIEVIEDAIEAHYHIRKPAKKQA